MCSIRFFRDKTVMTARVGSSAKRPPLHKNMKRITATPDDPFASFRELN